jgi:protocatechuate 3,4-dioxygenase beta subunit
MDERLGVSRAAVLGALGGFAASAALIGPRLSAQAADNAALGGPACTLTPAETEGPFFVDERLNRSNLTTGTNRPSVIDGVPLVLTFAISSVSAGMCSPLAGAHVDLWHADANGTYSDSTEENTVGETFLRGYQITDARGQVGFRTIYPGWYAGRAVHLHFKVRTFSLAGSTTHQLTSQLFLDDSLSDAVQTRAPYNAHGRRDTGNNADPLFSSALLLPVQRSAGGLAATFNLGLRMS